jgi:hypothetical protein
MAQLTPKKSDRIEEDSPKGRELEEPVSKRVLARLDIINSYRVAEFVTLARDGSPVCWPLAPDFKGGRLIFSTGYVYPVKARNAQRNPRVAALFSDPTASGRSDNDPFVLVQGLAEVYDQDMQRNTERYVDQLLSKGPAMLRLILHIPVLRQGMVGYVARIWIEVLPQQEYLWARSQIPPEPLRIAIRPASFSPSPGIELPEEVFEWLPRYTRPPILAYIDKVGWPVMLRVQANVKREHVAIESNVERREGAPACLTYHRLVGNYQANDAFLIRGHFDQAGRLVPERVLGYGGTKDDRGVGSLKMMRMLWGFRRQLSLQMEKEACPLPVVRPTREREKIKREETISIS